MIFRNKKCKRVNLSIKPDIEFKEILNTLDDLTLPDTGIKPQNIKYAVLEMINNSIRAHRENRIRDTFSVSFECDTPSLVIEVRDRGPGFNPERLPYSLADDPSKVDIKSKSFADYREQNNYLRFGMGLYVVRKTFPLFQLTFLDESGQPAPWSKGKIHGTCIKVGIKGSDNGA